MRLIFIGLVLTALFLFFAHLMKATNEDSMYFVKVDNSRIFVSSLFAAWILLRYGSKKVEYIVLAGYLILFGLSNLYPFYPTETTVCIYNLVRCLGVYLLVIIFMYICLLKLWQKLGF